MTGMTDSDWNQLEALRDKLKAMELDQRLKAQEATTNEDRDYSWGLAQGLSTAATMINDLLV
jgi:hypothetical protein